MEDLKIPSKILIDFEQVLSIYDFKSSPLRIKYIFIFTYFFINLFIF